MKTKHRYLYSTTDGQFNREVLAPTHKDALMQARKAEGVKIPLKQVFAVYSTIEYYNDQYKYGIAIQKV